MTRIEYHAHHAMTFARHVHRDQRRKYTGNLYSDHLAEVAGIVATVPGNCDAMISIAWLHDCVEDQGVTEQFLIDHFSEKIAFGVMDLSDMEKGNRAERKEATRLRLAYVPAEIMTIKVADIISNTSSIVMNDPVFAKTYLKECNLLLDVLVLADARLLNLARTQIASAQAL